MLIFPRRWAAVTVALGSLVAAVVTAQPAAAATSASTSHTGHHDRLRSASAAQPAAAAQLQSGGGAVLTSPVAYLTFWGGEWASGFSTGGYSSGQAETYLETYFQGVGGSGWTNVATQYCQGVAAGTVTCPGGATMAGNPANQYGGAWVDTTPVPASPGDSDIQAAADRAAQHFGYSANAVYFVVSPTGKSQSGFGSSWCAWHGDAYVSSGHIAYSYLPYMPDAGYSCGVDSVNSNDGFGHGYFDGFSIVGGHEYMESITDPYPSSGWTDSSGAETGDKCEWGGRQGNFTFPNTFFAVQPTWSNASSGCAFTYGTPAPAPAPTPTPTPTPAPTPAPTTYQAYFNYYDNASAGVRGDNIHIVNPTGSTVTGTLQLGSRSLPISIGAGGQSYYAFPAGSAGGPVVVSASARVIASQRVQFNDSFNEVQARTAADASTDMWFTWYDTASPGMIADSIAITNPNGSATSGTITVGAASSPLATGSFSAGPGTTVIASFPAGVIGGPVHVHAGSAVLASQRVRYQSTFNEVLGQSSAIASTTLYFNWFDKASPGMLNDNVHITNPTTSPVTGTVRLTATNQSISFSVPALGTTYVTFGAGSIGGPVVISASGTILASQRVQYYGSFNEVAAKTAQDTTTTAYMPWYDLASPGMVNDNIHLLNPYAFPISGTVTLAGQTSRPFTVPGNGETYLNLGVRIGGPVQISVSGSSGVLASQRVQYYQSFNEAAASS